MTSLRPARSILSTEVSEQLLPAAEPNERYFRLLAAMLDHLKANGAGAVWRVATYFSLWAVKLAGFLPELHVCLGCGSWLDDPGNLQRAFFIRHRAGLYCQDCRRALDMRGAWELAPESRALANEILHKSVDRLGTRAWTQATAADLRHFLAQQMESHIERKLITVPVLEAAA